MLLCGTGDSDGAINSVVAFAKESIKVSSLEKSTADGHVQLNLNYQTIFNGKIWGFQAQRDS